jgi:hypothetical protein
MVCLELLQGENRISNAMNKNKFAEVFDAFVISPKSVYIDLP